MQFFDHYMRNFVALFKTIVRNGEIVYDKYGIYDA